MTLFKRKSEKDGLVAILNTKSDLAILQEQGWYRIPVATAPRHWPPRWLAFYQPKRFDEDAYRIRYYGQVKEIGRARRYEIFLSELESPISNREYFILRLERLEELAVPIPSLRARRIVFIPTTWTKFTMAEQVNDLFDDSPLEDHLWQELKRLMIEAERQWAVKTVDRIYHLDFAIFCNKGRINVETDGDRRHMGPDRAPKDNARDNALQIDGWKVLRFNTKQIRESFQTECLRGIEASINNLGGITSDGVIPRVFYTKGSSSVQQLNLFDRDEKGYFVESEPEFTPD
jgi:very-short-patch-repair endonuclease